MNIVMLKLRYGEGGGLEKYTSRIASAFAKRGDRVTLLTTKKSPLSHPAIAFSVCKTWPWPAFIQMKQFDRFVRSYLRKHRTDLVFGMGRNEAPYLRAGDGVHAAYLKSRLLSEGPSKRFLCALNPLHRTILSQEKRAFESPSLKKLFANSYMVQQEILEYYSTDPSKIEVIHNGVEWSEMEKDFLSWEEGRRRAFSQLHLDPGKFHFLFVGNGFLRKGLDRLLEGFALLPSDVHLSIVGKEKRLASYWAKAVRLGIQDRVRFFGPQKEIRSFYQLADALVIPSFYDPFANVTVEALAMGLFVVSSKSNGGAEVLNAKNGVVIETLLDPTSLAAALQVALKHPKTKERSFAIRQSVAALDFPQQLKKLIDACR